MNFTIFQNLGRFQPGGTRAKCPAAEESCGAASDFQEQFYLKMLFWYCMIKQGFQNIKTKAPELTPPFGVS
jgi:hypothetical protein